MYILVPLLLTESKQAACHDKVCLTELLGSFEDP